MCGDARDRSFFGGLTPIFHHILCVCEMTSHGLYCMYVWKVQYEEYTICPTSLSPIAPNVTVVYVRHPASEERGVINSYLWFWFYYGRRSSIIRPLPRCLVSRTPRGGGEEIFYSRTRSLSDRYETATTGQQTPSTRRAANYHTGGE